METAGCCLLGRTQDFLGTVWPVSSVRSVLRKGNCKNLLESWASSNFCMLDEASTEAYTTHFHHSPNLQTDVVFVPLVFTIFLPRQTSDVSIAKTCNKSCF